MNEWNKTKQKQMFRTKINSAKSTITKSMFNMKIVFSTTAITLKTTTTGGSTLKNKKKDKPKMRTNYNVQNLRVLNSILQEFNLQLHLRVKFAGNNRNSSSLDMMMKIFTVCAV